MLCNICNLFDLKLKNERESQFRSLQKSGNEHAQVCLSNGPSKRKKSLESTPSLYLFFPPLISNYHDLYYNFNSQICIIDGVYMCKKEKFKCCATCSLCDQNPLFN